ncbi:LysE family translocator [Persephonella sp.]
MELFEHILFGLILGIAAGISPGSLLALLISETLRGNIKNGILVSISPIFTDIPIILVSLYLLNRLQNFNFLLGIISLTGSVILFYLGIKNIIGKYQDIPTDLHGSFIKGLIINILNPYTYLFWFFIGTPYITGKSFLEASSFVLFFFIGITGSMILIAISIEKIKIFIKSRYYYYLLKFIGFLFIIFGIILTKNSIKYLGF